MKIYNFRSSEKNYTLVPNSLIEGPMNTGMSPETIWLILYLLRHKNGKFNLSIEKLMTQIHCGRDRINRMVREAKAAGYLYYFRAHSSVTGLYVKNEDGWFALDFPEKDISKLNQILNEDAPKNIYLTIVN